MLVVDDDFAVRDTFKRMLTLEGFAVRTAADAQGGLAQAIAHRVDAIVLDLRMPLVDGLGFLHQLREHATSREIPVAIVTGDYLIDDATIETAQALGAVQFGWMICWTSSASSCSLLRHSLFTDQRTRSPQRALRKAARLIPPLSRHGLIQNTRRSRTA